VTENKLTNNPALAPACDEYDPHSLNWQDAQQRILNAVTAVTQVEWVPLRNSLNRILAKAILSPHPVPNHTNSAMDGYAFQGQDLNTEGMGTFLLVGESFAGKPFTGEVSSGQCVRIMTGAVMPRSTDSVVMQEHTSSNDKQITLNKPVKLGANVRQAGEDLQAGETVLPTGKRLTPADTGIVASLGMAEVAVFRRPRVAFFSNGDELKALGSPLQEGDVYDANRYTLFSLLTQLDVEIIDLGIVPDNPVELRHAFLDGQQCADMLITSAGASVGDADYVAEILQELGDVHFWKVAIKPGRPVAFGQLGESLFFGLPGNPVAVMVTFAMFVVPALRKQAGEGQTAPLMMKARCISPLRKRPGRTEFQRAVASSNKNGELVVTSTGKQGSGILSSMRDANCFIILADELESIAVGELVDIYLFKEMV